MEIITILILAYAIKKAWDDSRSGARKSRKAYMKRAAKKYPNMSKRQRTGHALRHDIGHGLSQLFRGFPNARHGFAAGWHEGRQAHAEAMADRERAKAEHLETRARLLPGLADYRRRQREAMERIRSGQPDAPPAGIVATDTCPECGQLNGSPHLSWCPELGRRAWDGRGIGPEDVRPDGEPFKPVLGPMPEPEADDDPPADCDLCGLPLPPRTRGIAHPDCIDARESESGGERETSDDPDLLRERDLYPETSPAPPTEGNTMPTGTASDVTYDGVLSEMNDAVNTAEQHAADVAAAKSDADNIAEQMQALDVDPSTLSAMADHADALDEAEAAHQKVLETAQNVQATLEREQGQLAEAHKNTSHAAEKSFFEE